MLLVSIIGTAGSGKTFFTWALKEHLLLCEENAVTVNLDPAAKKIPYSPEIDSRDYIDIDEIILKEVLGPNAALIIAYEKLAEIISEINDQIKKYSPEIILVDTPGQLELFILKKVGIEVLNSLEASTKISFFLIDALAALNPKDLITQLWLGYICQFRLKMPMYYVLSKSDMVNEKVIDNICKRIVRPQTVHDELVKSKELDEIDLHIIRFFEDMEERGTPLVTSAELMKGFKNIHKVIDEYKIQ